MTATSDASRIFTPLNSLLGPLGAIKVLHGSNTVGHVNKTIEAYYGY
jgi:hypothetical protein